MTMCCNTTDDAFLVLNQEREVRQHQVDAMHIGIGKHETAVDKEQLAVLFKDHAVTTDLTKTAEEINAYGSSHELAAKSGTRLLKV